MKGFKDLEVWEKSHHFVEDIYQVSGSFPDDEKFGLTSQIKRSAVSIPSNIAEGCGRNTDSDFARFLQIAMGSASECQYQIYLAHDLGYLSSKEYENLNESISEIKRMLSSFLNTLNS